MRSLHFISGLPRSGSTLLAALLRQNPRFHASMSGPVAGLLKDLLESLSAGNEFSLFISDDQRHRILQGVVENYYGPEFTQEVIFDTSRAWCARMALLHTLVPGGKVIACVRDVPWIIDSIERLIRRNALQPSSIFGHLASGTVYSRADGIANGDGMLGYGYNALKEAFFGEYAQSLMLVRYETLVSDPAKALKAIYQFVGEPYFEHDTGRVEADFSAFDKESGTPGLHEVRSVVENRPRKSILPPDVYRRFEQDSFWNNSQVNPHEVIVV
jgi:sulfotransferase